MLAVIDITSYLEAQAKDLSIPGVADSIGIRGQDDLKLLEHYHQGKHYILPRHSIKYSFILNKGSDALAECWINAAASRRTCRATFKAFLECHYGIPKSHIDLKKYNVDHLHALVVANRMEHGYVRLALTDARVNQAWGNWEKNYAKNNQDGHGLLRNINLAQVAKLAGVLPPTNIPTEEYLLDFQIRTGGETDDNSLTALIALLMRGLRLPPGMDPTEYAMTPAIELNRRLKRKTELEKRRQVMIDPATIHIDLNDFREKKTKVR
ncbi:hypothetical protein IB237_23145 [Agrobacterium sp. AGB01]|jgi:hypothetical protein|uniref:hypothetical protein n=1 Tax=Agrobacterium sp. AGB01 TaxID=2769302 RepID=UPI001786FBD0|nr:hypothetical protein [Agrobacterium sp. AGB01]MBD9390100.1 hypothetical protein [Agrobacterium sp. AGB01]